MLPNNPALQTLTSVQKTWILANMLDEAERVSDAELDKPGRKSFGISEEEFKLFSQRQRELAAEERKTIDA